MLGRIATLLLATAVVSAVPGGATLGSEGDAQAVLTRNDDEGEIVLTAADDDDDTNSRNNSRDNTSGVDSNDRTGSGHTAVSRDRDRSRGDKTRDFTRDGGDRTRDRSAGHTNDRSRNDTR